jgi:hydroxyacylglutathione hydrolase
MQLTRVKGVLKKTKSFQISSYMKFTSNFLAVSHQRLYFVSKNYSESKKSISSFFTSKNFSTNDGSSSNTCTKSQCEPVEKIFDFEAKNYFVRQLETSCLSQFSYYIESQGEAVIIDPMRECDVYLDLLKERQVKLKYILETHFHADFVSGHLDLAKKTGAQIVFGPQAKTDLQVKIASDGEILTLGKVGIKVFHTPGHTLESSSFLLMDPDPKAIFTGDFLFLGEVGRPDLAVGTGLTKEYLASLIYDSVQRLKKEYPDNLVIFPGHGAGSACGKKISKGGMDTLKHQKIVNYALSDNLSKEEFIHIVSSNLPTPPAYFFHDAVLNKSGYEELDKILEKSLKKLEITEFLSLIKNDPKIKILDTREAKISTKSFYRGAFLIPLQTPFAIFASNLCKPEDKIIIISDPGQEKESIVRLTRIGYEKILGYIHNENLPNQVKIDSVNIENLQTFIEKSRDKIEILDVREANEWQETGCIEGAHKISFKDIENNQEKIRDLSKNKQLAVHCKTGVRANIAISILKKLNIDNVINLGGYNQLSAAGVKFSK